MKRFLLLQVLVCVTAIFMLNSPSRAQSVGIGTNTPHASAIVEMQSNSKGMLPPRMSWQQIQAIPQPANGLVVYDNTIQSLRMFDGSSWTILSKSSNNSLNSSGGSSFGVSPATGTGGTITALAVGPNKSVYFGGSLSGTLTVGNFSVNNPNDLFPDVFFGKYDSLGNIQWLVALTSNNSEGNSGDRIESIAVDAAGNMYVAGYFGKTLDFDPGPGVANRIATVQTGFYAKYSPSGDYLWVRSFLGASTSFVKNVITDGVSLYMLSEFLGTTNFLGASYTSAGSNDILLTRVQCSDGDYGATGWSTRIGGTSEEDPTALEFYASNIIIGGSFTGTCNFGGSSRTSAGATDGFFATYNTFGVLANVYVIGGPEHDYINDIVVDVAGNIYCGGEFTGTCNFNTSGGTTSLNSAGQRDGFIAKYSNIASLVYRMRTGGTGWDAVDKLAINYLGEVYAVGYFEGTASFTPYTLTAYNNITDMVFIKMSGSSNTAWVEQLSGIAADASGVLAIYPGTKQLVLAPQLTSPYLDFSGTKRTGLFYLTWFFDK